MVGTLVNAAAVAAGGLLGMVVKKGIPTHVEQAVMRMMGLVVAIIGLNGTLGSMFSVDLTTGKLVESGTLLLLMSMAVGTMVGEFLRIEDGLDRMGSAIEARVGAEGLAKGFISAALIFCVGAMSIVGSFNAGISGDNSILFLKSALDGVTSILLGSALGIGVPFAAAAILLYQGVLTMASGFLAPLVSGDLLQQICMVGYVIVMAIGLNLLLDAKIRTANLLPALLGPVVYNLLIMLKTL